MLKSSSNLLLCRGAMQNAPPQNLFFLDEEIHDTCYKASSDLLCDTAFS